MTNVFNIAVAVALNHQNIKYNLQKISKIKSFTDQ